jgi:hypothetical protein
VCAPPLVNFLDNMLDSSSDEEDKKEATPKKNSIFANDTYTKAF